MFVDPVKYLREITFIHFNVCFSCQNNSHFLNFMFITFKRIISIHGHKNNAE